MPSVTFTLRRTLKIAIEQFKPPITNLTVNEGGQSDFKAMMPRMMLLATR